MKSSSADGLAQCEWIRALAEPYLRGYEPRRERGASLEGYRFFAPGSAAVRRGIRLASAARQSAAAGFFVGYLVGERGFSFLRAASPECLVFCFIEPAGGKLHRRLVRDPASLLPSTAKYIGWLTHRPPRFKFFADEAVVLVRHSSMRAWPREKYRHFSNNFFIETLAWVVRSALVRRLPAELEGRASSVTSARYRQATGVP